VSIAFEMLAPFNEFPLPIRIPFGFTLGDRGETEALVLSDLGDMLDGLEDK